MREEPATFRKVYEKGDQVTFVCWNDAQRFGIGACEVEGQEGDEVRVSVHMVVKVPTHAIALRANRPMWMEPGYVKGE